MNEDSFSFDNVSFEKASEYFREKINITPSEFRKIAYKYKSLAFTVAGYTKIQVLKKFKDELQRAIDSGTTQAEFKNSMNTFLEKQGYTGISAFQADNIFRTNIQTAYQVGHYEQLTSPMVKKLRPYWQYDAVNDKSTRPSHLAMDGKVFPADSPVWDTWYPPNGFRCRCAVTSLSKKQVEDMGIEVENVVPRGRELADGRFVNIFPDGNFATNPAKTRFSPDLEGYPDVLVKAYQKQSEVNK